MQAADVLLSGPQDVPDRVEISGPWVAWDDYGADPAVVRWRNLDTGAHGTLAVPGLKGPKGTYWTLGDGFVVYGLYAVGEDGLRVEKLATHVQEHPTTSPDVTGYATDGSLLYWAQGTQLHRLDVQTGIAATLPAPDDLWEFDVSGDWMAWTVFEELDPDASEFSGYVVTVPCAECGEPRGTGVGLVLLGHDAG